MLYIRYDEETNERHNFHKIWKYQNKLSTELKEENKIVFLIKRYRTRQLRRKCKIDVKTM